MTKHGNEDLFEPDRGTWVYQTREPVFVRDKGTSSDILPVSSGFVRITSSLSTK